MLAITNFYLSLIFLKVLMSNNPGDKGNNGGGGGNRN